MSEAVVKLHLKEKDCQAAAKGAIALHACGPAAVVAMGLLIEDTQYVFLALLMSGVLITARV